MSAAKATMCAVLSGVLLTGPPRTVIGSGSGRTSPSVLLSLEFEGGSLAEYVKALRNAAGGVNIALMAIEPSGVHVPPMRFDSVSVEAALDLVKGKYQVDEQTSVETEVDEVSAGQDAAAKVIYRITVHKNQVKVWGVLDLFGERIKPDDVLTAVETAIALFSDEQPKVQVRFHERTGVLIARGTPRQIATIDSVIEEIRGKLVLTEVFTGLAEAFSAEETNTLARIRSELQDIQARIGSVEVQLSRKSGKSE